MPGGMGAAATQMSLWSLTRKIAVPSPPFCERQARWRVHRFLPKACLTEREARGRRVKRRANRRQFGSPHRHDGRQLRDGCQVGAGIGLMVEAAVGERAA